ncbi:MAG: arylesterase, partial [Bacteroidetes Order II. Incertae sedis bacterium]|nr:arylesterase [Bacteroidetes Order II. bacterium]
MKLNTLYTSLLMMVLLMGCSAENSQKPEPAVESTEKQAVATPDSSLRILFLGDSITAGFGLGEDLAFPALLQAQITESGYSAKVSNAGISGDTSTGGLARTDWLLQSKVDILVLELGGNDGLRGI